MLTLVSVLALSIPRRAADLMAAGEKSVDPVILPNVDGSAPAVPIVASTPVLPDGVVAGDTTVKAAAADVADADNATSVAATARPASLAMLVKIQPLPLEIDAETRCLAAAVYFESRAESLAGQLAVAHVVINRAASPRFPSTLCDVVHQHRQFHFLRSGQIPPIPTASKAWETAVRIAEVAKQDSWANAAPGALFFHARHVSPGWKRPRIAQIDNHIFYR